MWCYGEIREQGLRRTIRVRLMSMPHQMWSHNYVAPEAFSMGPFSHFGLSRPVSAARWLAALLVISAVLSPVQVVSAQSSSPTYYIEETGHSLGGSFLDYWMNNDGLTELGLPVTEPTSIQDKDRQYFQYGVLDRIETGDEVVIAEAGRELLALRHNPMLTAAGKRTGAERVAAAFAGIGDGTGDIVEPNRTTPVDSDWATKLEAEYEAAGGLDRFGLAMSDTHFSMGKIVRWFADGRIESWNSPGAEAVVAPIGKELALLSDVDTTDVGVGDLVSISGVALASGDTSGSQKVAEGALGEGAAGFADAAGAFAPTRLVIPAIGVDAYIEQVGIYDGVMGTPAGPMNVGWYPAFSSPGTGSNVVMAGHVDYYTVGPAVFYSLGSLGAGSEIYVTGPNGEGITYAVTGSTVVGADTPAENVLGGPGGESLTLITCGGSFNGVAYDSRTIVYAVRI